MLLVGIDWAETQHAVCLLDAGGTVRRRLMIPHSAVGLRRLCEAVGALEPRTDAVLVALERPDGLLVEGLLASGYTVYALNPRAVERYRERTRIGGAKTDEADADLLARILFTDRAHHRPLQPNTPELEEIRVVARQDERASRDEQRLLGRLRQDLLDVFPQALAIFPDLRLLSALAFLARWPSVEFARAASIAEFEQFLREHHHGWARRTAERIREVLHGEALAAPPHRARAKSGAIQLAAQQLLLLRQQRKAWQQHLASLLEGPAAHPDGELLLSLPGLDVRLAARVLGEIGDDRLRFPTPAALQCYAGTAPVTKASGRLRVVIARRACNRLLRRTLEQWAFCSIVRSDWARAFYDQQRHRGKTHQAALRALAHRWLEILHHLLSTRQRYDELVHQRNRRLAA